MKRIYFFIAFLLAGYTVTAQDVSTTQTETSKPSLQSIVTTIIGMACQEGCADVINSNLKNTGGITSAATSFETGKATIEFNPNLVSIDNIKSVITRTKVKDYTYTIDEVSIIEILK